ncbi:hypothetical protein [Sinorhizobium fredii]|uniref:hypothetical protein n=1 Tax=Rhizobium fredii TaxID=380 RepID=UPI0033947248
MTYLEEDVERAIQLFMAEYAISRDDALRRIVRDWLVGHGYLDALLHEDSTPAESNQELLGGA